MNKTIAAYIAILFICTPAFAQSSERDFVIDEHGTITEYVGRDRAVVIPAQINGRQVLGIGSRAFESNGLTSVVIPQGVTHIGDLAFIDNGLTSVTIPNSVIHIEDFAFSRNQLTSVTIPNGVTHIGAWAFNGNELTSMIIPNSVTHIGDFVFADNK